MKIKLIKQRDSEACGPTSIKMVTDYFEIPISLKEIGRLSKYKQREGLSNRELKQTLTLIGLKTREKKNSTWADLQKLNVKKNVIVLSWMYKGYIGHFSILEKVTKDHIHLADPHAGTVNKMQKTVFMRLWFDYDEMWFPKKNTDIQLRWMLIVSK